MSQLSLPASLRFCLFLVCCPSAADKRPFTATICSSMHFLQSPQRFLYRLTMTEISFFARIFGTETSPQGVIPLPLQPSGWSNRSRSHRSSQLSSILTPFLLYVMDTVKWTVGRGELSGGRKTMCCGQACVSIAVGESGDCVESVICKGRCRDHILEILGGQEWVCQVHAGVGLSVHAVSMSPSSGKYFTQSP